MSGPSLAGTCDNANCGSPSTRDVDEAPQSTVERRDVVLGTDRNVAIEDRLSATPSDRLLRLAARRGTAPG